MSGAKKKKTKSTAVEVPVPQSRDEAVEAIAKIGVAQRERERIQAEMNDRLATIKQEYEEQARPHNEVIKGHSEGVKLWCAAHRKELTQDGKTKTVNLSSGWVKWRLRPPSVKLKGVDDVIARLKGLKLNKLLRLKTEVNKDAILAEPEKVEGIDGIKIEQKEDFVIEPFESELEEVV